MARAIAWALRDAGFKDVSVVSRNLLTGARLASDFGFKSQASLNMPSADLLLNATPIGMAPHSGENDPIPFSKDQIEAASVVIDSVASPPETRLVRLSRDLGKHVVSGFEITVLQAIEQFELYTGTRPSAEQARRAALCASSF
jgi:shikimate dehydrogenase